MGEQLDRLKQRLSDVTDLEHANSVLSWDESVYMPPGGTAARASQMATLARLSHDMFTHEETGRLLAAAASELNGAGPETDDASLIRVSQRDYDLAKRVPSSLVAEISQHGAIAYEAWKRAREENDYAAFAPYLEKTIELSRRVADHLGYEDQPYDALLDYFEPGMKTTDVQATFADLKDALVPLVRQIAERTDTVDDSVLYGSFPVSEQEAFSRQIAAAVGYDFERGRLDETVHPFETSFSRNDVRITTRYEPGFVTSALFSTLHEAGHGMYEQGVDEALEGTPLGSGTSLGVHESQSRLWENVVGRSRGFWTRFYPDLQALFPEQLGNVPLETFYRAINKVQPSLVRVEADEVTYNLHIMLRLEMELALLSGELSVADAPAVWDDKMEEYLGVRPPTDALGILQDVHWAHGMMGYFPTYTLGNILSAQLYDKAIAERPTIPDEIARGEFSGLRGWLTEKLYRHGRKYQPPELIQRVTGEPLQTKSYLAYLRRKFGEIYDLPTT